MCLGRTLAVRTRPRWLMIIVEQAVTFTRARTSAEKPSETVTGTPTLIPSTTCPHSTHTYHIAPSADAADDLSHRPSILTRPHSRASTAPSLANSATAPPTSEHDISDSYSPGQESDAGSVSDFKFQDSGDEGEDSDEDMPAAMQTAVPHKVSSACLSSPRSPSSLTWSPVSPLVRR